MRQQLNDLATPVFVINRMAFRSNCELVRIAAHANGINRLRPHVKTHKSREGALIQAGIGSDADDGAAVVGFVVSTIPELAMLTEMASRYECMSFRDILYGIPICKSKLSTIARLKDEMATATNNEGVIHLLVDNAHQVNMLEGFILNSSSADFKWSVLLKIDSGYHRAGVTCDTRGILVAMKIINSSCLILKGLYSHCGHAYNVNNDSLMKKLTEDDHSVILEFMKMLADHLKSLDTPFDISLLDISVGSTASMFCHDKLNIPNNVELHCGNYVFYDRQQLYTGACTNEGSIAGFVLARVIGHYNDEVRNAIMVDAGATALTKEGTPQGGMCAVYGWPNLECYRMSQEVTMIRLRDGGDTPFPFEDFPFGSTLLLVPNHSCLAAACFDTYYIIDEMGDELSPSSYIVDTWKPVRGWT